MSEIVSTITKGEGFQGLVKKGMESLMQSERNLHNELTSDVSNGYRDRKVYHGGQMFELRVPRSRNNSFYPMLLGVLKDQEEEAQKLVSSLYTSGLTTEQVGRIYEEFYGKHYSKSQVSRLLNGAREEVGIWLERKLDYRYPVIYIDATYVLTRRDACVSNEAYYTVLGVKEDRTREVLSVVNFPTESSTGWQDVFTDLRQRGVSVVNLVVSDGLSGIENSITSRFPMAEIQLCTVHLKRNILSKVKPRDKQEIAAELKKLFSVDQFDIDTQRAFERFKEFITKWQKSYPALKKYHYDRYRLYFTYFKYEREIRGMIYTTNWIERLNKDYKRVLNMRGAMPNPQSVILLMGNVARNRDVYKYPIYNFLESNLFNNF